ncbi:MFS transporter [Natronosporangium hydrolyticum]|uniref:MFS transporter n=1 Tax=Natronosporangium hydrolyticum TaxID=2811111 RepID=UPI001EFA10A8|nr:MFS transporter [Natronosporangium hydrolyticum]
MGAPGRSRLLAALVGFGLVLVALNLRTPVTSLGALLTEVSEEVGLSPALAGVATMLPTISFGLVGGAAPWLVRRYPPARILTIAMVVLAAGTAARASTDSAAVFLACSALALAGIAISNVLLPMLVKLYFPTRIGMLTGAYTMSMILGNTAAAGASVPVAEVTGSWRVGIGVWALLALVAAVAWLPAAWRDRTPRRRPSPEYAARPGGRSDVSRPGRPAPVRTRLGWLMAIHFGAQALNGYAIMGWLAVLFRDAGYSPAAAGLAVAAVTLLGIPLAFVIPTVAAAVKDLRPVVLVLAAASVAGYTGLAVSPASPALLWLGLLAVGQAAFPFALTLIGLRSRTPVGTVSLSAFTQSAGYLVAGFGPLLVGVLYGVTGGWVAPLGFLIATILIQAVAGLAIARPRYFEDEIDSPGIDAAGEESRAELRR